MSEIVAELLEDILKRFVNIWYDCISASPSFIMECKSSLRQGCALLYERIHQAKWPIMVQRFRVEKKNCVKKTQSRFW